MYEDYFSLSGPAFRLNPDPAFFFGSRTHNKAMSYLHYGLKQGEGFIVITGEAGAGKTVLVNYLIGQVKLSGVTAALLSAPNAAPDDMLPQILAAFGVDGGGAQTDMLEAFERFLFEELTRGRRVLLIADEAQNLPPETLDKLRVLSNINYEGTPLLQIFLAGGLALEDRLREPQLAALQRRVIASYRLEALTREETREYILHRLSAAGWREDPVFSDDAVARIYDETGGAPIRINLLCNRIMLYCAVEKRHEATAEIVEVVLSGMRDENLGDAPVRPSAPDAVPDAENGAGLGDVASALRDAALCDDAEGAAPSEFDRLIGARRAEAQGHDRQEATLSDVASAIAAAANGETAAGGGEAAAGGSAGGALGDLRKALRDAGETIAALRCAAQARRHADQERDAALASALSRADALVARLRRAGDGAVS